MAPVLGYWKIRGLAQGLRLVLKYAGVEFEDNRYEQGPAPEFSRESWYKEKETLGLELPNLPYYIDGDMKITETTAIYNHLGRKFDLLGKTETEKVRNDMAYSFAHDHRMALVRVFYSPEFDKLKDACQETIPKRVEALSKLLGDHKYFAGGEEPTTCDFAIYDLLDIFVNFVEGSVNKDNLKQFMERVEALPAIKAYMDSDAYLRKPFNSKIAKWGGME